MQRKIIFLICSVFFSLKISAQMTNDLCVDAQNLCPNTTYTGSNFAAGVDICAGCSDGATSAGNFCFELNNTIWFSFTTNSSGGDADISFSDISCLVQAGYDDAIQAVIIEAGTACDESTYTSVSNCESGSAADFILSATGLLPNTTYYVLVDGELNGTGITNAAECTFSIEASGPAIDPDITLASTPATCGASDGTVTVTNTDGGLSPYSYTIDGGSFQPGTSFSNLSSGIHTVTVQDANGCLFFEDMGVDETGGPDNSGATITAASCTGNDGQIQITGTTGGTPAYTYTMVGGGSQASPDFSNLPAGSYTIIISDQSGCTDTVTAIIDNTTGPDDATVSVTSSDCGASTGEITVNVVGGTAPYQYSLNGGATQSSAVFSNLAAGSYTVLITDASGCTFLISDAVVDENPPSQSPVVTLSQSPNPACVGELVTFTATVTNGGASTNFEFFVNGNSVQSGGNASYSDVFNSGDMIMCEITSNDACISINTAQSIQVSIALFTPFTPTTTLVSSVATACQGDQVSFTATSNDCTSGGTFSWQVDGTTVLTTTSNTANLTLQTDAAVSVILSCDDACAQTSTSNTVNINITEVFADAGNNQMIAPGSSTILDGSGTAGGTFSWTPTSSLSNPNISDPVATPNSTTTYLLTVTANGCTATDDVIIIVSDPIIAPNTFTPNGDGTNDLWEIIRIENYPNCKVTIYDRWGQKIFNTVGYTNANAWDGTNNGMKLPASTYFYVIDLNTGNDDGDIYNGTISIVY